MNYSDLRDFIAKLQEIGDFKRVSAPISPNLEMTEVCDRILRAGGPAVLFEKPVGADGKAYPIPVLANLFGTPRRVALGMGADDVSELRRIGHVLARLKEPEPPKGFRDIMDLEEVLEAHTVAGDDCYLIKVRTDSIASLNTLVGKLKEPPLSLSTRTTIVMQTHCEKVGGIILGDSL